MLDLSLKTQQYDEENMLKNISLILLSSFLFIGIAHAENDPANIDSLAIENLDTESLSGDTINNDNTTVDEQKGVDQQGMDSGKEDLSVDEPISNSLKTSVTTDQVNDGDDRLVADTIKKPSEEIDDQASDLDDANAKTGPVQLSKNLSILPTHKNLTDEKLKYEINLTYPKISGKKLNESAIKFNKEIEKIVNSQADEFKKLVKIDSVHMKTLPEDLQKNGLDTNYSVYVSHPHKNTLISVRLTTVGMQAGRAHPFHQHYVLNYDLLSGKVLQLRDLFKPGANYLRTLSIYSKNVLNKKLEDKFMIDEGTKPLIKNYSKWNVKDNTLMITFEEYQVAPYVYGPQVIEIPFSKLNKIIAK